MEVKVGGENGVAEVHGGEWCKAGGAVGFLGIKGFFFLIKRGYSGVH